MPSDGEHSPMQIGGYTLMKELASGTSGHVYAASKRGCPDVAIKVIPARKVSLAVRREVEIHFRQDHPNIASLHDVTHASPCVSRSEPPLALIMELCPRGDLFEEVKRIGPLKAERLRRRIRDVAAALRHLHLNGVVHGDVKCENVGLAADGTAKLLDFGCARDITAARNEVSTFGGTTQYLAPELIARAGHPYPAPPSAAADAWALGVVAYVAAACAYPFCEDADADDAAVRSHIVSRSPVALPADVELPTDLAAVIDGLLVKDVAKRMTVADVLATLEAPQTPRRRMLRFPPLSSPGASPPVRPLPNDATLSHRGTPPTATGDATQDAKSSQNNGARRPLAQVLDVVDKTRMAYTHKLVRVVQKEQPPHGPCGAPPEARCC